MERWVKYSISCGLSAPGEQSTSSDTRLAKEGLIKVTINTFLCQSVSSCASPISMSRKGCKKYFIKYEMWIACLVRYPHSIKRLITRSRVRIPDQDHERISFVIERYHCAVATLVTAQ